MRANPAEKLTIITAVTEEMNAGSTLDEILGVLYGRLQGIVPYERIGVALVEPSRDRVRLVSLKTEGVPHLNVGYTGKLSGSSLDSILKTGRPRIINDLQEYLRQKPESGSTRLMVNEGMRCSLTLPLVVKGRPVGVIFFSSRRPGQYREEHIEFLQLVSGHVAIAVEKSILVKDLREKGDYLENLLQNSADAIIVVDRDNIVRTWNRGAEKIFGYTQSDMVGRPVSTFVPPEAPPDELERIMHRVDTEGFLSGYETVRMTKDGRRLAVSLTTTAIRDESGRFAGRSAILRDLTPLKKLQEELVRNQSLAAVGELAASVAHEIKNPLAGMSGAAQILRRSFAEDDSRRKIADEILNQIRRLDNTVRDLLVFARPWKAQVRKVDLVPLLDGALRRLEAAPPSVRVGREGPDRFEAMADPQLLDNVLLNVLQNALDSMPSGGRLDVRLREENSHGRLEISDTGVGIAEHHRDKLFKPFFSTKARGTGLGLAISRKLIEAQGGSIELESSPGLGTTVTIRLPRHLKDA
jgi:PAS domain S-box-containing protein